MKTLLCFTSLCATLACTCAGAAADPAPALSFNTAVTSDYRYRGISQTRLQSAVQGGIDYSDSPSGLYVGAWSSTITWTHDAGGGGHVELDVYGGQRGDLGGGIGYDLGLLRYQYPSNGLGRIAGLADADTTELYGQLSYRSLSMKYSASLGNLFGFADSKHSGYLDLSANPALSDTLVMNLHLGRQRVAHNGAASYTDWKVGVSSDRGFATVALAVIGTNAGKAAYASPANGKFLGKPALQLTVSKTF